MSHRPRWRKWLFAIVKLLAVVILLWFLRGTLSSAIADLKKHPWHVQPAWLVFAGLCYAVGATTVGIFWNRLLRNVGQDVGLFETLRAFWVSSPAKYVPGKVMVLVLRAGLLRSHRLEVTVVTAAVFVETLTLMAVGALISFVVLTARYWHELTTLWAADGLGFLKNNHVVMVVAALGMFVGLGLPTFPPIMKFLTKLLGAGKFNPSAADKIGSVSYRVLALGWMLIAIGWFVQGLGLWATLRGIDAVEGPPRQLAMDTATVAMSTVAGFLSFIPGGAVVREAVQAELMVGDYGEGPALVATLLWRLVMVVTEVVLAAGLFFLGPRKLEHKLGGDHSAAETA
jgi:uncharacterized membrane protein YbhN (UPF0104 family)